jgi:hypothetical protein
MTEQLLHEPSDDHDDAGFAAGLTGLDLADDPAGAPAGASHPSALVDVPPTVDPTQPVAGPARPIWSRVAARIVRRPRAWIEAPWPNERIIRVLLTFAIVGGSSWAALQSVHLDLILRDNTPTGGDMGSHVMGPAFLRDHLLPHWKLSGWSNYWYDGFPMYRFYMVIPALMIVLINVLLPYGVAFKIVVVLGIVTLPVCCWAFGRLASFRYPMPELFALAGLLFLFDESFSIYGGNVKSTMAGEFSFSIALSLGILGLGLFAKGLETGKYRVWAAVVLSLACLSHGIVLIFVLGGAVLLWLVWMDRTRWRYGATTLLTAVLLMSFWVVPFLNDHAYMTDMKYGFRPDGPNDSFWKMFFPLTGFFSVTITTFAVIGFVASIVRRHLNGAWLGICTLALVAGVYVTRDSLPVIGLLWNPRLLPFIYLLRYMLMMVGVVETVTFVYRGMKNQRVLSARQAFVAGSSVAAVVGVLILVIELMFFRVMPGADFETHNGKQVYQWGPIALSRTSTDALSDAWSRYNFLGYEDKPAYGEYRQLVLQMETLGNDPQHGCGRALWENNEATGQYGTTMSLMLLPHWTDGCIASMEGLFFEASGTTPYHFITAAAMSKSSSNPVRALRYDNNDATKGVPYLQALGVKYVMVFTGDARKAADAQPALTKVASVGPWNIYQVADSDIVVPLKRQPVVVNSRGGDPRERNLELGMSWFQHQGEWAAMPADGGPASWQRIDVAPDASRHQPNQVDIVQPREAITPVDEPAVNVSNFHLGDQDVSFDVDQVGVPVLVKVSYFPNWEAEGAQGPWRVAPNLMVVVPTSKHVTLRFTRSNLDLFAYALTVLGIALAVFWRVKGDVVHLASAPYAPAPFDPSVGVSFDDEVEARGHDPTTGWEPDGFTDVTVADPLNGPPADEAAGEPADTTPSEGLVRPVDDGRAAERVERVDPVDGSGPPPPAGSV